MATDFRRQRDQQRKSRTRDRLLDSAARVFVNQGYRDSLISDIVADAALGQGTFYRNFTNKRACFQELFDRFVNTLVGRFDNFSANLPASLDQYRTASIDAVVEVAQVIFEHRLLARLFLREGPAVDREFEQSIDSVFEQFAALAAGYLDHAIEAGFARPCDSLVVSRCLVGMARRLIEVGLQQEPPATTLRRTVVEAIDFAFLGFAPRGQGGTP